ncbi:MAG: hypothetical protein AAFO87_05265 [Cyanobacteria bacterium J06607_6]
MRLGILRGDRGGSLPANDSGPQQLMMDGSQWQTLLSDFAVYADTFSAQS